ncbi:hypothetical protein PQX77_014832 [Marasmius sp. AFHP31]|nr:hypothetical protein PQX77_014832 [Marasmius sp. AFHP31]
MTPPDRDTRLQQTSSQARHDAWAGFLGSLGGTARREGRERDSGLWNAVVGRPMERDRGHSRDEAWTTSLTGSGIVRRESPMKEKRARRSAPRATKRRRRDGPIGASHIASRPRIESSTTESFNSQNGGFVEVEDNLTMDVDPSTWDWDSVPATADEEDLEEYIAHFQEGSAGFIPIGTYLYVVQGWNRRKQEPNDRWYHFEARRLGTDVRITCTCPDKGDECVHAATYLEFREERFGALEERMFRDGQVVWYWREMESKKENGMIWSNRFSVGLREGATGVDGRAMVTFVGPDDGIGNWHCDACATKCVHRSAARSFFSEVMGLGAFSPEAASENDLILLGGLNSVDQTENSISYRAIRPPQWAILPTDLPHYKRPDVLLDIPGTIVLQEENRSLCGLEGIDTDGKERTIKKCTVFTLTGALNRDIELVGCPNCPSRKRCFIGPEPWNLGLFNFNNSVLFTHELLDEYTSQFTSSETPFVAFVETINRIYSGRGCAFVKEDLFQSVWFAYVSLQDFSRDMICPKCGPEPETLIWDGVTLGFGRKHLLDSLKPPTHTYPSAPTRQRRYPIKPQLVPDTTREPIRRHVRRWAQQWRRKPTDPGDKEGEEGQASSELVSFDVVLGRLMTVSPQMAALLKRVSLLKSQGGLKGLYGILFEQLAAEESALQMVNARSLSVLKDFSLHPDWQRASQLVDIPAIYNVLEAELRTNGVYPRELVDVCKWLHARTTQVLNNLTCFGDDPVAKDDRYSEGPFDDEWKQVRALPGAVIAYPKFVPGRNIRDSPETELLTPAKTKTAAGNVRNTTLRMETND